MNMPIAPSVARLSSWVSSQYAPTLSTANTSAISGVAHRGSILILGFLRAATKNTALNKTRLAPSLFSTPVTWVMAAAWHGPGVGTMERMSSSGRDRRRFARINCRFSRFSGDNCIESITLARQLSADDYNRCMADVVRSVALEDRRRVSLTRRRRDDLWIGSTALIAAMLALPAAQNSWHGPEVSAVLAVSATALLAGQRWAVALVVLAELMLLPTVWPRAFFVDADLTSRIASRAALALIVPGVIAMRRAAAALVLVTGRRRTPQTCRRFHVAMVAVGVIVTILPIF